MIQIQAKYLLAVFVCSIAIQVSAQQIPSRTNDGIRRNEARLDQLKEYQQLHLSAGQQQKLRSLQKETRQKTGAIRTDPQLTNNEKKEKLKQLFQDQTSKRNAILTPQQQQTWQELALTRKQSRSGEMITVDQRSPQADKDHDRNGLPKKKHSPGNNLTLTQPQKQKISALNAQLREKVISIKNNTTLSDEQKKEQLTAIQKDMRRQRKEILTAEQWQQWKALDNQQKRSLINF